MEENELCQRLFRFAVDVVKMLRNIQADENLKTIDENLKTIIVQLGKSATSSGANYEESQGAVSRPDFGFKVGISLKEMRESNYWIRILHELFPTNNEIERLTAESLELKKILGSIHSKISPRSF